MIPNDLISEMIWLDGERDERQTLAARQMLKIIPIIFWKSTEHLHGMALLEGLLWKKPVA